MSRDALRRTFGAALVVMLALIFMGGLTYGRARMQLMNSAKEKYGALRDVRTAALEGHLTGLVDETRYWAKNSVLQAALATFRTAWEGLGDDPRQELQKIFIEENPFPVGEKDSLEFAPDGSDYADAHASYHEWFRRFLTHRGFYDVFLIDPAGNLVYTVFKEMDYATNLETGPYKDTGLARVFRQARANPDPEFVAVADFEPYAPSHGAPGAFLASPVVGPEDELLGVLGFQIPSDRINEIMQAEVGMRTSGETYVVGGDLLMRSNSRFSEESTVLKTEVDTVTVRRALAGNSGIQVTPDYRGIPVLSAYTLLEVEALRWAVMAEIDEHEVVAPILSLRSYMVTAGVAIVVVSVGVLCAAAFLLPSRPAKPVHQP